MSETTEPETNRWQSHFWKVVAGICIGFGGSQLTIVSQVNRTERDVTHLEKRVNELDVRTEKRIGYLTESINTSIRQNSESISLTKEQLSILRVLVERNQR